MMAKAETERIGAGGPKTKQAFAQYFASFAGDNSRKMEKNTMKRVERDGAAFVERKEKPFQSNTGLRLDGGLEETDVAETAVDEVAAGTAEVVELSLEEQTGAC